MTPTGPDPRRPVKWWTGALTDRELAAAVDLPRRLVRLVLDHPSMKSGITGGGHGRASTRRLSRGLRNAIAIVGAFREMGLRVEFAVEIIAAVPELATDLTPVVDFTDQPTDAWIPMTDADPKGPWRATDMVPRHVVDRRLLPAVHRDTAADDLRSLEDGAPLGRTRMVEGRPSVGRDEKRLPETPPEGLSYAELDPLDAFSPERRTVGYVPETDELLLIVDGRWIFRERPNPDGKTYLKELWAKGEAHHHGRQTVLLACIDTDGRIELASAKHVDFIEDMMRARNFVGQLSINTTLAVRRMKRRALGLPMGEH